jgi:chloramphenicol 3-O-phosphotransferase
VTSALVLTGAPGAGKSSVLDALTTLLELEGVEHGAIESEQLARGFPPLANAVLAEALARTLAVQRRAGRQLLLVAFTAETAGELRSVVRATGAERVLVACLAAPAQVLAARLQDREPDRWPGKAGLIAHAHVLASVAPALAGIDITIDTDGAAPDAVAHRLLSAMRDSGLL